MAKLTDIRYQAYETVTFLAIALTTKSDRDIEFSHVCSNVQIKRVPKTNLQLLPLIEILRHHDENVTIFLLSNSPEDI